MDIQIKKYLNIVQFLHDAYSSRKRIEPSFSYEVWAQELQASDKSYVRLMVIGKRPINRKMAEAFAQNLKLTDSDRDYFFTLIEYSQSKSREQKDVFGKKLIFYLKSELDQLEIESHYEFLSNPLLPRLQVILSFHDVDHSCENLSWILGVSEEEIRLGLTTLTKLQLIERNQNRYRPLKKSFKVADSFGNLGLEKFYHQNLSAAQEAINLPHDQRRFKSLFLPLTRSEFTKFVSELQDFVSEQLFKYNSDEFAGRRLYQTHFNIFPVSHAKEDSPETRVSDVDPN